MIEYKTTKVMLRILILLSIYVCTLSVVAAQRPFITTWKTDNDGISCSSCITIPTFPGETYNYDVDWDNDGVYDDIGVIGGIAHDYETAGTYTVAIRGLFPRIYFNGIISNYYVINSDAPKIIGIEQWGDTEWVSMENAFKGCDNLITSGSDMPILNKVASTAFMFGDARNFNGDIGSWDISNVTNMSGMLYQAENFNQDISRWDVSGVEDMSKLFDGAVNFNQDIRSWDVSSVSDMSAMFAGAYNFDQDIGSWNVSSVTNMVYMFSNSDINHDISGWDVSSVTNMRRMFNGTAIFNQDIGIWDVSSVTDMSNMFSGTKSFNQDISSWDVSSVVDMEYMFSRAENFNQDIIDWDVSSVTDMSGMFDGACKFNQDISSWDVSSVTNMRRMFNGTAIFNQDIGIWDVSSVTDMSNMFSRTESFNQDISSWDVSSVADMKSMFFGAESFNQGIGNWDVSNVVYMHSTFSGAISFNQDINSWDVSNVVTVSNMFSGATNFNQDLGEWDLFNLAFFDSLEGMLDSSGLSIDNYEATLRGWADNPNTPKYKTLGAEGLEYCDYSAWFDLTIDLNWTITGDTQNCMTSNSDITPSPQLNVWPNPASDRLHISGGSEFDQITMRTILGREVLREVISPPLDEYHLDIDDIQSGIYILTVMRNGIEESQKIEVINE